MPGNDNGKSGELGLRHREMRGFLPPIALRQKSTLISGGLNFELVPQLGRIDELLTGVVAIVFGLLDRLEDRFHPEALRFLPGRLPRFSLQEIDTTHLAQSKSRGSMPQRDTRAVRFRQSCHSEVQ